MPEHTIFDTCMTTGGVLKEYPAVSSIEGVCMWMNVNKMALGLDLIPMCSFCYLLCLQKKLQEASDTDSSEDETTADAVMGTDAQQSSKGDSVEHGEI